MKIVQQIQPRVLITAIISGTFLLFALISTLAFLAYKNADASTILSLVSTLVATATLIMQAITRTKVQQIQEQTNGTQTKLINASIVSPPADLDKIERNLTDFNT